MILFYIILNEFNNNLIIHNYNCKTEFMNKSWSIADYVADWNAPDLRASLKERLKKYSHNKQV